MPMAKLFEKKKNLQILEGADDRTHTIFLGLETFAGYLILLILRLPLICEIEQHNFFFHLT